MQAKRIVSKYSDWVVLTTSLLLIAFVVALALNVFEHKPSPPNRLRMQSATYANPDPFALEAINPKFPPPPGQQRAYNKTYTEGDVQYTVAWVVKNIERNPKIGSNEFTIDIKNTRNRPIEVEASTSVSLGCVVMDSPYRHTSVAVKNYQFSAYELKQQRLDLPIDCLYVGTADGKYFWVAY